VAVADSSLTGEGILADMNVLRPDRMLPPGIAVYFAVALRDGLDPATPGPVQRRIHEDAKNGGGLRGPAGGGAGP
jgi:hypothetical protein